MWGFCWSLTVVQMALMQKGRLVPGVGTRALCRYTTRGRWCGHCASRGGLLLTVWETERVQTAWHRRLQCHVRIPFTCNFCNHMYRSAVRYHPLTPFPMHASQLLRAQPCEELTYWRLVRALYRAAEIGLQRTAGPFDHCICRP